MTNTIIKHVTIDEIIEDTGEWLLIGFDDDTMADLHSSETRGKRPMVGDRCTIFAHIADDGTQITHGFAWGELMCWGTVEPSEEVLP